MSHQTKNIRITQVPIEHLKKADYNPRTWSDVAKEHLKESIKRHGFVEPVLVNCAPERKNIIIGGHFRVECAKELGFTEVPVVYINIPSLEKERELNLRLNRNTGSWDYEVLKEFDVNLLLDIGFDESDLSNIWSDVLSIEDDNFDVESEAKKINEPQSKLGDLCQLGSHYLICGDSTDFNVVKKLVGNEKIDAVLCDPIYNIGFDYKGGLTTKDKYGGSTKDKMSDEDYKIFLKQSIQNALAVAKPDVHVFYFCDQNYIGLLQEIYRECGITNKRVCMWIKNNFNMTPHVAWNKAYEPCVYGTTGKPYLNGDITNLNEILNKEINSGNRCLDDIIDLFDIWLAKRVSADQYVHPTQKPLTLYEKPLKRCTKSGDTVLDLFGGSGTVLHACEQMKRKAFVCEIDPVFCDVIIKRFEEMTGVKAIKLS
jgi:DNA modification methylase